MLARSILYSCMYFLLFFFSFFFVHVQLLDNVFDIMVQKNPELAGGEKKPLRLAPPNVVRLGTKKTGFTNFVDICKLCVCAM